MPIKKLTPSIMATLLFMGLSACTTVGPDYKVPDDAVVKRHKVSTPFVSAQEAVFKAEALPAQWWRLYDDALLDSLIEKAFTTNTDLRIAAANLARAYAILDEAKVAGDPSFNINAAPGYGRASAAAKGLKNRLSDGWSYDAGINISYQIDLFGKIARSIEAAGADIQAAEAAQDITRITVAAEVARAYMEVCSVNHQTRVAEHSVSLQKQFLDITDKRAKAGRATDLDISRARGQFEKLRSAVPPLQAQQKGALYRLAVLTGDTPDTFVKSIGSCNKPVELQKLIPVGDGAALLRRRPDIRQAERYLAASTARIGVATADLYPSISLGLSAGSTGLASNFGDANAFRWNIGPLISWTLPNTGTARSRIAQTEASTEAALARFDAVVLNALRETESALTVYARELDRNALLRAARDQSELASRQANKLYRYGRAEFLTTLDADRTLASDESALAASSAKLASDQINLFLSLGGGWEQSAPKLVKNKKE